MALVGRSLRAATPRAEQRWWRRGDGPEPTVLAVADEGEAGDDRFRSLGHAFADGYVVTRYGSVVRRRCALQAEGVIGWNLRASWFQRRLDLVSLRATTAAGRQSYTIVDISPAEAIRFADTAVPGLLTEFLSAN